MNRKLIFIIIVLFLCYVIVLIPYFYMFNDYLSNISSDWSHFGGYVGGLLAPIFSFITIIYLIKTHYSTLEQNIRKDKLALIYRLEDNIQNKLNEKVFLFNENSTIRNNELTLNIILHPIIGENIITDPIWLYVLDRYYDILIDYNELKHLLDDYYNYTNDQWLTNSMIIKYVVQVNVIKHLLNQFKDQIEDCVYDTKFLELMWDNNNYK